MKEEGDDGQNRKEWKKDESMFMTLKSLHSSHFLRMKRNLCRTAPFYLLKMTSQEKRSFLQKEHEGEPSSLEGVVVKLLGEE